MVASWVYLDQIPSKAGGRARYPYATKTVPLTPVIRTEFICSRPVLRGPLLSSAGSTSSRVIRLQSDISTEKRSREEGRRVLQRRSVAQGDRFLVDAVRNGVVVARLQMTLQLSIPIGIHTRLGAKYVHSVKEASMRHCAGVNDCPAHYNKQSAQFARTRPFISRHLSEHLIGVVFITSENRNRRYFNDRPKGKRCIGRCTWD